MHREVAIGTGYFCARSHAAARKQQVERGIFEEFARSARLTIVDGTISQPDPPDILCEIEGLGRVAFELVQLDSRTELSRMNDLQGVRALWADALEGMSAATRARHLNSQIDVVFRSGANQRVRRDIFAAMIDGPRINEVSPSGPTPVDLARIDGKITHYPKGWPDRAELLAYSRWGMPFSDQNTGAED